MRTNGEFGIGSKRRRVFLVDQFPISRMAVSEWLRQTSDLAPCGEADNGVGALSAISRLKPDVVVTEILEQQNFDFIRSLHQQHPRLPILVFSFRDEAWYAPRALEAGADGYLMKGESVDGLLEGIRGALEGRVVLSPQMRARFLQKCFRVQKFSARKGCRLGGLRTERGASWSRLQPSRGGVEDTDRWKGKR